jgi:hypothetical protein
MNDTLRSAQPFDQEVTGDPVEAHGYVVTPVARVRGRLGSSNDERGSGRWGFAAIRPLKVSVLDREGNTQELRIVNTQQQAIAAMASVGLIVALISLLIPLLARARRG